LATYGPEATNGRAILQRSVIAIVERFWSTSGDKPTIIDRQISSVEALYDNIQQLMPRTETAATSLILDLDNYGCSKSPALPCERRQASLVSEELALCNSC
jgi:hypothetical protein